MGTRHVFSIGVTEELLCIWKPPCLLREFYYKWPGLVCSVLCRFHLEGLRVKQSGPRQWTPPASPSGERLNMIPSGWTLHRLDTRIFVRSCFIITAMHWGIRLRREGPPVFRRWPFAMHSEVFTLRQPSIPSSLLLLRPNPVVLP